MLRALTLVSTLSILAFARLASKLSATTTNDFADVDKVRIIMLVAPS